MCEEIGIDLDFSQAMQSALGLPRAVDPDEAIHLRADMEAAARVKVFLDMGLSREQVIAVGRVLGHGLAQTAEAMREVVLEAVLSPGASELELARSYEAIVRQVSPLLGPLCDDVLRVQLRHTLEIEAVSAAERAAGVLPGAQHRRRVRRPGRLHPARRSGATGGIGKFGQSADVNDPRCRGAAGAVHQNDR